MFDNLSSPDWHERAEEWIFLAVIALAAMILAVELLSLYYTPVPDSYLWWGDESWLMTEFRTQILTGIFRYPYALGSTLAQGSGMIFGNMWIPALLYGVPSALVPPPTMDLVLLGRTVTAIIAFTLVFALYEIVQRVTADRLLAAFSVLLLITSRSFLFTSHSARYDVLSALAILIGIYFLFQYAPRLARSWQSALVGFATAATMLITIHVTLALSIAAFVTVLYHAPGRRIRAGAFFVLGAASFIGILATITVLRGLPILSPNFHGAFALNIRDIPALRFYSRSVQVANIFQRLHTIREFGFGYLLTGAVILVLFVTQLFHRKVSPGIGWRAAILAIIVFSWLEFESAAPSSYLIYILPVLSFTAALAVERMARKPLQKWLIAGVTILLAALALRDMPGPHGKGYVLVSENYGAVETMLDHIEESDTGSHPLVLVFTPAVHEALRDTNVRVMTTQFIEFPRRATSVDSVLHQEHAKYALVYLSAIKPDYMREVQPILHALNVNATPLWEQEGHFTDIGRSYFNSALGPPDTIRLYQLHG